MTMNSWSSGIIRGQMLLSAVVCSMSVLATSSGKQCGDSASQKQSPVIIRNIGIKMCQVKCAETGGCLTFNYDLDTLTCRLRLGEWNGMEKKKEFKNPLKVVPPSTCSGTSCSLGARCLESRAGKAVCVKAGATSHPLRLPKQRRDKKRRPGESLFHQACREVNLSLVRDIFSDAQVFLNSGERDNGRTSVMLAARGAHIDVFDFLVSKGCDMSLLDIHGNNLLHMSCYGGQVAVVKHVLALSIIDFDFDNQNGRKCWMSMEDRKNREHGIYTFAKAGRNVSMVHQEGDNILHIACKGRQLEMVKYVISEGIVDVNSRGQDRKNVFMFLSLAGYKRIFDLFACTGCNLSAVDGEGNNILHLAIRAEKVEMVEYLISENLTDINSRGSNGWTPVMLAAMMGQIESFDLIVSRGGNTSVLDDEHRNILHLASYEGKTKMVKHIVSKNIVDVSAKTKNGVTAAEIAEGQFFRELSDFLTSQGRQGE